MNETSSHFAFGLPTSALGRLALSRCQRRQGRTLVHFFAKLFCSHLCTSWFFLVSVELQKLKVHEQLTYSMTVSPSVILCFFGEVKCLTHSIANQKLSRFESPRFMNEQREL